MQKRKIKKDLLRVEILPKSAKLFFESFCKKKKDKRNFLNDELVLVFILYSTRSSWPSNRLAS